MHVGVDLAPKRAQTGLAVDVLHHRDGGLVGLCDVAIVGEHLLPAAG